MPIASPPRDLLGLLDSHRIWTKSRGAGHRGVESERSFLRDIQRFFVHLFPDIARVHPSSSHRRVGKLRRFLEPLRRQVLPELVGDSKTLLIDSTLLEVLHPRQVN
ncbi:MAG TPA: hypothetical protein VFE21_06195 [Rubrobacteraceae bacterium]|nr:hypothetical protein [Rubrobacteraceae bacterium]